VTTSTTEAAPAAQNPVAQTKVRLNPVTSASVYTLLGAACGALAFDWVIYERVLPFTGALGFWLCWYAVFLVFYSSMAVLQWDPRAVRDKIMSVAFTTGGVLATAIVVDQVAYTLDKGWDAVRHSTFLTQTLAHEGPLSPITTGGVLHAIVGTLEQISLATIFAVPLGIAAALFLAEIGGRMARPVRTIVDAMTALPDVIAGLFVLAFFILTLGFGESGVMASVALGVTMLPIVTRASEAVLRLVPNTLREASYALGASQWRTVLMVVVPTARSGLSTAVVLAMARGIGETAPVLLTAGYSRVLNGDPFHNWQTSLPLFTYYEIQLPQLTEKIRAFGAAFVLVVLVLILFTLARRLGGRTPGELSKRQRRRIAKEATRP
jgi:phosphate transport system permease protein